MNTVRAPAMAEGTYIKQKISGFPADLKELNPSPFPPTIFLPLAFRSALVANEDSSKHHEAGPVRKETSASRVLLF